MILAAYASYGSNVTCNISRCTTFALIAANPDIASVASVPSSMSANVAMSLIHLTGFEHLRSVGQPLEHQLLN